MRDIDIVNPNHPYPAKFITLEGIDGSGKTTQMRYIQQWGIKQNFYFELTAEPTRFIRNKVLGEAYSDTTCSLMFLADRSEHNNTIIIPALKKGRHIISDRYFDSTYAYSLFKPDGMSGILNYDLIRVNDHVSVKPDLTILFDLPIDMAKKRVVKRKTEKAISDLFDEKGFDYFEKVREGYLRLAQINPGRIKVIDATKEPKVIFEEVQALVEPLLSHHSVAA